MKTFSISLFIFFCTIGICFSQTMADANKEAEAYRKANGITKNTKRNIYIKDDVIHIFIFEDGNLLLSGYPTTATENNKFQVHLFVSDSNSDKYKLEVTGNYEPVLTIENANKNAVAPAAALKVISPPLHFPVVGPFTTSATFTLKKVGATPEIISNSIIRIAKTLHASIGTGLIVSFLRDPINIKTLVQSGRDTTLIADNTTGSASLTIMATLYPGGRNTLMLEGRSIKERFGIVVGTNIASNAKNFKNFLLGAQYDFSFGGSLVAGIDVSNRQLIQGVEYDKFVFGETKFSGDLANKLYKKVGVGVFFGVQVDSRIFAKMFSSN